MTKVEEELPRAFAMFIRLAKIAKEKIREGSKKKVDTAGTASTSEQRHQHRKAPVEEVTNDK